MNIQMNLNEWEFRKSRSERNPIDNNIELSPIQPN